MAKQQAEEVNLGPEHFAPGEDQPELTDKELTSTLTEILGSDPEFAHLADEEPEQPEPDEPADEGEPESNEPDEEAEEPEEGDEPDEEDEASEDGDESEEEEKPEEGGEEEPEYHRIKIGEEEYEATLDELKDGYSRTKDYTRKTQKLADERREAEAEFQEKRGQYEQQLEVLERVIKQSAPHLNRTPEQWQALKDADSAKFVEEFAEAQLAGQKLQVVQKEQERVQQEEAEVLQARMTEHLEVEKGLLLAQIPEWKEEDVQKAEKQALMEYASSAFGYTEEDMSQVVDHRLMLLLRNSMLYEQGQSKGKERIRKKVSAAPRLRPGARKKQATKETAQLKRLRKARKDLAQSGSERAAQAAIFEMLDD